MRNCWCGEELDEYGRCPTAPPPPRPKPEPNQKIVVVPTLEEFNRWVEVDR